MKGTPNDLESIILTHHERPNGKGFPHSLTSSQLGALPSLFIVAHDLANYLWIREKSASIKEFVDLFKKEYLHDHFKKINLQLKKSCS